ncbi:ribosomal large subunit pseudouridine synthase F [Clostridium cavendishii DSM 21758]|uniref:Pseudouridine synthase n=1 Tax=Clostridium cavendishii DSM 21758 TaxID=1121302 RepID=A0A1M6LSS2_9CLOT|nr:23S rRNA pseudouridine(2604) synthase RluF [Clostridium cavendishii]SHJ74126.1 ribosomal large subunit pseudouridine synthase F [Clostridium cavendishii DSM 21758]
MESKKNGNKKVKTTNVKQERIIVHEDKGSTTRLNKYISESGFCSRREADKLIDEGRVTIDGSRAVTGTKVSIGQVVKVDGKTINRVDELVYIALNKPVGITCTTEAKIKENIVDFIGHEKRIFPIGRLDKDSQGLIFLTNDGDIVNKILRAGNNHEKEYIVTVDKLITEEFLKGMASGVPILDTVTNKCFIKREGKKVFRIILTQGLNRQIRRMCEYFGYNVTKLERIRIMNVKLGNLKIGNWRNLTKEELKEINKLIAKSVKIAK